jgi:hypothetical protein
VANANILDVALGGHGSLVDDGSFGSSGYVVHHKEGNRLDLTPVSSPLISQIVLVSKGDGLPPLAFDEHVVVGTGAFLGGRYSKEALINFGGIPKEMQT